MPASDKYDPAEQFLLRLEYERQQYIDRYDLAQAQRWQLVDAETATRLRQEAAAKRRSTEKPTPPHRPNNGTSSAAFQRRLQIARERLTNG